MRKLAIICCLLSTSAWAAEPIVSLKACLTQEQLAAIINSAIADAKAAPAIQEVQKAFSPAPERPPGAPSEPSGTK